MSVTGKCDVSRARRRNSNTISCWPIITSTWLATTCCRPPVAVCCSSCSLAVCFQRLDPCCRRRWYTAAAHLTSYTTSRPSASSDCQQTAAAADWYELMHQRVTSSRAGRFTGIIPLFNTCIDLTSHCCSTEIDLQDLPEKKIFRLGIRFTAPWILMSTFDKMVNLIRSI